MGQKTNSSIFRLGLKNAEWKYKYIEKNIEESSLLLFKNIEIKNYINNIFKHYNFLVHNCNIEYTQTTANVVISFYKSKFYTTTFSANEKYTQEVVKHYKNNKKLISFIIKQLLNLSLNLYIKNKIINIKVQDLNKKFELKLQKTKKYFIEYQKLVKQFKRFLKNPMQKDFIKILFISISEKNSAKLIADSIAMFINKNKKRHNYLLFVLKKTLTELIKLQISQVQGIKIVISGRFNGVPRGKKKVLKIGIIPLQSFNSTISYYQSVSYTPNGTFGIKVWICEK